MATTETFSSWSSDGTPVFTVATSQELVYWDAAGSPVIEFLAAAGLALGSVSITMRMDVAADLSQTTRLGPAAISMQMGVAATLRTTAHLRTAIDFRMLMAAADDGIGSQLQEDDQLGEGMFGVAPSGHFLASGQQDELEDVMFARPSGHFEASGLEDDLGEFVRAGHQFSMLGLEYMGAGVLLATGARRGVGGSISPLPLLRLAIWRSRSAREVDAPADAPLPAPGYFWHEVPSIIRNTPAKRAGGSALLRIQLGGVVSGEWGDKGHHSGFADQLGEPLSMAPTAPVFAAEPIDNTPSWRLSLTNGADFQVRTMARDFSTIGDGSYPPPAQLCLTDDGAVLSAGSLDELVARDTPEIWRGVEPLNNARLRGRTVSVQVPNYEYRYEANAHDFPVHPPEKGARELIIQVRGRATTGRVGDFSQIHVHNEPPDMSGIDLILTPMSAGVKVSWENYKSRDPDIDYFEVSIATGTEVTDKDFTRIYRRDGTHTDAVVEGLDPDTLVNVFVTPADVFGRGEPTKVFSARTLP